MTIQSGKYTVLSTNIYNTHNVLSINCVIWHHGTIPDDEIWLKLGGDKGGGSLKMCFQHLNIPSPNVQENTSKSMKFKRNKMFPTIPKMLN